MLARAFEAEGIATTSISMVREHTEKVKPPRALFVPFPFGFALGRPDDPALQHRVLGAALALLTEPVGPVLRDFPDEAEPGVEPHQHVLRDLLGVVGVARLHQRPAVDGRVAPGEQGLAGGGVPGLRPRHEVTDVLLETLGFAQPGSGASGP